MRAVLVDRRRRLRGTAVGLALSLMAAACGSTVQTVGLQDQAQVADSSGLGTGAAGDGLSVPGGGTAVAGRPGAAAGTTGGTGTTALATGPTPTGATGGTGSSGSGVPGSAPPQGGGTDGQPAPGAPATPGGSDGAASGEPIQLGAVTFPDIGAFSASFGGSDEGVGDQNSMVRTAIDWINANGGVAGRPVEIVISEVSLTSTTPYAQRAAEICAEWTEDNDVVAGVFIGGAPNDLPACLSDRGRVLVTNGHQMHDAVDFAEMPFLLSPAEAGSDRVARALAAEIAARGLAEAGDVVGLLTFNYPSALRSADLFEAAITARGATVARSEIRAPESTPDIANSVTQVQSAQLRMAALGADTVTFLCPGCDGFFMQSAASQGYMPTYALTSLDTLGTVQDSATAEQLADAFALGWEPLLDVGTHTNPEAFTGSATRDRCAEIMGVHIRDDATEFVAHAICDSFLFLKDAADAGGAADGASIRAGAESLGGSRPSGLTFASTIAPDRHDGVTGYRPLAFDPGCGCLAYTSTALTALP